MTRLHDRFWDWATDSFVRFAIVVVVAYRVLRPQIKREH